jgi:hypothetical protein
MIHFARQPVGDEQQQGHAHADDFFKQKRRVRLNRKKTDADLSDEPLHGKGSDGASGAIKASPSLPLILVSRIGIYYLFFFA